MAGGGGGRILDSVQDWIYSLGMITDPIRTLRDHGLQVTPQRMAVLRAVASHPHATADGIWAVAREEIGSISRQSVYDALAVLVERGVLRRVQPAGSPARYEDRVGDNHHHLVCRECGRVEDVDCAVGAAPCLTPSQDRGFEVEEAEVVFLGRCPECRARLAASSVA